MGRSARWFNKRIEIWQSQSTSDGFGGATMQDIKITDAWAKITTTSQNGGQELGEIGISDPMRSIKIMLRKRNDINYTAVNQFIIYQGQRYEVKTEPTDLDFNHSFIEFWATRVRSKNVETLKPLGWFYENYEQYSKFNNATIESETCLKADIEDYK